MELWERLPDETVVAFSYFRHNRDMPEKERNVRDAYRQCRGKPKAHQASGSFMVMAQKHDWLMRSKAWDAEKDRIARQIQVDEIVTMTRRHAQQAAAWQQTLIQPIRHALARLNDNPKKIERELNKLTYPQLVRFAANLSNAYQLAVKMELLARGEPTELTRQQTTNISEEEESLLTGKMKQYAEVFQSLAEQYDDDFVRRDGKE
jgi:hypothetical protein